MVEYIKDELTQVLKNKKKYLVIKKVEKKIEQMKIKYLIKLLILLKINYYQYLINGYSIIFYLYHF